MACSCNKKGFASVQKNRGTKAIRSPSSPSTPPTNLTQTSQRSVSGMVEEKKKIQRIRREAIKRALGK